MLKIQEYIYCFNNIDEANIYLKQKLNIENSPQTMYDADANKHKIYVYYPGMRADLSHPIVRETQGLMLYGDGEILTKMYNFPEEVSIRDPWPGNDLKVSELPDGQLLSIYNLESKWRVASHTKVMANDYMKVNLPGMTYATELMAILGGQEKFSTSHPDLVYVFNLVSKYDIRVMPYTQQIAYLMTIVDRRTGKELDVDVIQSVAKRMKFERPASGAYCKTLTPGIMINSNEGRFYVANPIYTAIYNALQAGTKVSPTHMAKIFSKLRDERDLDVVGLTFDKYERMLDLIEDAYSKTVRELHLLWNDARLFRNSPAEFAGAVKDHPLNFLMFQYKDGEVTDIRKAVQNLKPEKLIEMAKAVNPTAFETYTKVIQFEEGGRSG